MNSTSILELFVVKGKEAQRSWLLSAIIVIITAIVIAAIAVFAVVSPISTIKGETESSLEVGLVKVGECCGCTVRDEEGIEIIVVPVQ